MTLTQHARRAVPWRTVAVVASPAGLCITAATLMPSRGWAPGALQAGLVLLALPAAFLLDDPAAAVTTAAPRSPWWDLAARILVVPLMAVAAGVAAAIHTAWAPLPQPWVLVLVPAALTATALASSAVLRHRGWPQPGETVASILLLALLGLIVAALQSDVTAALPIPGTVTTASTVAWSALLVAATLLLPVVTAAPRR